MNFYKIFLLLVTGIWMAGCGNDKMKPLFTLIPASHTGIRFSNEIIESDTLNILKFEYIYNGSGVGVGDLNNDGLTDIFFAGNQVSSQLYLNKGNFAFEDITKQAGVSTQAWCTGVAMIDINQDGWLDIYVSTVHPDKKASSANLLFLNKGFNEGGNLVFKEVASLVGLADTSYATQAAFLDYDRDGDLDMYLLTNSLEEYYRNQPVGQKNDGSGKSVDKLYRNDGNTSAGLPFFKDVSKEAGIQTEGWGLGVVVNDINQDGWPDIYVANDFLSNDHLWINNQNGTFTNKVRTAFKHTEYNGMGVDIADINNDALNDIVVMDMMPDDNLRQKTMFSNTGYDRFFTNLRQSYQPQYVRNVLQYNNGNETFSDIGYLAGIYATDWSWSSLFADFDNDGYRDLLITNGYRKDITDLDFVSYNKQSAMFGTDQTRLQKTAQALSQMEGVKKPNFLFRNKGDLTFENKSAEWGLAQPSYTNGAAYADFDNDGDLDLVMNNINDPAFVYQNNSAHKVADKTKINNFLRVKLEGEKGNQEGYGAKIWLYSERQRQYAEHELQRGYKSTVENYEHFGLAQIQKIDSLKVLWPTGKIQSLRNIAVNQVLTLKESNATRQLQPALSQDTADVSHSALFSEMSKEHNLFYKHEEQDFPDFKSGQPLLPRKHSQQGPALAVGDVTGDGLDDVVIGGSAGHATIIFHQKSDTRFVRADSIQKTTEDTGLLLFDADNDGDNDLYCVSGSSEFGTDYVHYQDRLYRNDGKGRFTLSVDALPPITASGSCVVGHDYDKDGDIDLFVGGRVLPMKYPYAPESYLLRNNGQGKFENITQTLASELSKPGMVTSALWSDYDNDGWTDLLLVGEFMPVTLFKNEKGQSFRKSELANSTGWWNSLTAGDFDNDGDMDYIAGNLGQNSVYQASGKQPVCVYAKDYDQNGTVDPVLCRYIQGKEYVTHPRETLTDQIVGYRRQLTTYATYGKSTFQDLFPLDILKDALILRATHFYSTYIENKGNGSFSMQPLPVQAQFSPLFGMVVTDLNQDGNLDILAVGNDYATETLNGWYDAGIGVSLQGDGKGHFLPVPVTQSGFFVRGDAKALVQLHLADNQLVYLVTQNQDRLQLFVPSPVQKNSVSSAPKILTLASVDASAEIILKNGKRRKEEFYYGSSYLSQSSRAIRLPASVDRIILTTTSGQKRVMNLSSIQHVASRK